LSSVKLLLYHINMTLLRIEFMWLQTRLFLLIAVMFGILYGVITGMGTWMGAGSAVSYIVIAFVFLGIQYLICPSIFGLRMKIKWFSEKESQE